MDCPDLTNISKFLQGDLAPQEAAMLEEHLDKCPTCRRLLAELADTSMVETVKPCDSNTVGGPIEIEMPAIKERVGRFEIVKQLGIGGMGIVYLARDTELDRQVCLKFLHPETSREHKTRILGEARAMARLSHPNVVSVYEVEKYQEQLFVVMEYVEGTTLRDWLIQAKSTWRMVVEVFRAAAKGLAAAHQAGVVHRDFKPDNVLVAPSQHNTNDMRVLVGDFGLAHSRQPGGPKKLDDDQLLGTPAYMSPEQIQGRPLDAKTDQFSFCVALFEALYGTRPFAGKTLDEVKQNILAGKIDYSHNKAPIPGWLKKVVVTGLNCDPDLRHNSMDQLVTLLSRGLNKSKYILSAAAVFALMAMALGLGIWSGRTEPCQGAEDKLVGIWDKSRKTALKKSFLDSKLSFAPKAYADTAAILDNYSESWLKQHRQACLAGQVRQERSKEHLDLRMQCLDERLQELKVVTDFLDNADNEIVSKAVEIAGNMTSPKACSDVDALAALPPIPQDVAIKKAAQDTRAKIKQLEALVDSGKIKPLFSLAQEIVKQAEQIKYAPLEAESLYWMGKVQRILGKPRPAKKTFDQAILAGTATGHQRLVALAWIELVELIGVDLAKPQEANQLVENTSTMLDRIAAGEKLKAALLLSQAKVSKFAGKYKKALSEYQAILEIFERLFGSSHPKTFDVRIGIIELLCILGNYERAQRELEEMRIVLNESYGIEHPKNITLLRLQARIHFGLGNYHKEKVFAENALALSEKIYGTKHPQTASCHHRVAHAGGYVLDFENELTHLKKSLEINQEVFGPNHPSVASDHRQLAFLYNEAGQYQKAEKAIIKSIEITRAIFSDNHHSIYESYSILADIQQDQGELEEALQNHLKVIEWNKRNKLGISWWMSNNLAVAEILMEKGKLDKAFDEVRRTMQAVEQKSGSSHPDYSDCLCMLFELLLATKDYTRAEKVLSDYLQALKANSDSYSDSLQSSIMHWAYSRYYQAIQKHDLALEHFKQELKNDEQLLGKHNRHTCNSLVGIGRALLDLNRPKQALEYILRAHEIQKNIQGDPINLAEVEFALARALWDTNKDKKKALDLAQNAYKIHSDNPRYSQRDQLAAVKKWLRQHDKRKL
jgi:serine/threonine-protein kinase